MMRRDLAAYAPAQAPTLWLTLNGLCLLWSLLLFFELLYTFGPLERLEGTRAYLVYNFVTTVVWAMEVVLTLYHMGLPPLRNDIGGSSGSSICSRLISLFQEREGIMLALELVAAIYFLGDSAKIFWYWFKVDEDVEGEMLDVLINLVAYAYIVKKNQRDEEYTDQYTDLQ